MLRGIYAAASGMLARQVQQERLANDLANVNTAGYKRERWGTASFPQLFLSRLEAGTAAVVGPLGTGTVVTHAGLDLTQGPLQETGRPQDLALQGEGFFAVAGPDGVYYTRAGQFQVGPEGLLQTPAGWPVLGVDGQPLLVGSDQFQVTSEGQVLVEGVPLGQLARVTFANPAALRKVGENLYQPTPEAGPAVPAATPVRQGYLEQSNVDPVRAVVELLENFRAFEGAQRALQAQDETLGLAINQVGRVDGP